MRGSVGGTNYLSGPQHQIIARQRSSPVRPTSTDSTVYRSAFTEACLVWRLMSPATRAGWNDYAQTLYHLGPTGGYTVTGRNTFLGYYPLHRYLKAVGLTPSSPTTFASKHDGWLPLVMYIGLQAYPPAGLLRVTIINGSSDEIIMVYLQISRAFDGSRTFYKGPWTTRNATVKTIGPAQSSGFTFKGLQTDSVYFVRARALTRAFANARYSKPSILRGVAV